jgi:hypothetical protein
VWDKQQPRDFYWTVCLTNMYRYTVGSTVVTNIYVKSDKGHVTCTAYWNWLQWKTMWFVCLLNIVTCTLSPLYTPVYDIIIMCKVSFYIFVYIYIYTLYTYIHSDIFSTSKSWGRVFTHIYHTTWRHILAVFSNAITCNSYCTVP